MGEKINVFEEQKIGDQILVCVKQFFVLQARHGVDYWRERKTVRGHNALSSNKQIKIENSIYFLLSFESSTDKKDV